ncbi:MAG: DUF6471 domain-containing protein [Chitinophagales bacterium]
MLYTNEKVKRLLKSELVKRGITTTDLVILLNNVGLNETKSSIASKISRGTFSATFFLQCLDVIGCSKLDISDYPTNLSIAAEPKIEYTINNDKK